MELLSYPGRVFGFVEVPNIPTPPPIPDKLDLASVLPMIVIGVGASLGLFALLLFFRRPTSEARRAPRGRLLTSAPSDHSNRRRRRRTHRAHALSVGQTGGLPPLRTGGNQSPPA